MKFPNFDQSRIIRQLKHLSKEEIQLFSKYLESPFFQAKIKTIEFFQILIEGYPFESGHGITSENIIRQLYPDLNDKQIASRWKQKCHKLQVHLENFLIQMKLEHDPLLKQTFLMDIIDERQWINFFDIYEKKCRKNIQQTKRKGAGILELIMRINETKTSMVAKAGTRNDNRHFSELISSIDAFYYSLQLPNYCALIQSKISLGKTYGISIAEDFVNNCRKNPTIQDLPLLKAYFCILELFFQMNERKIEKRKDDALYAEAKKIILQFFSEETTILSSPRKMQKMPILLEKGHFLHLGRLLDRI